MDRYDLAKINRDELRKMLTRMRAEEKRVAAILEQSGFDNKFRADYKNRAKRKDLNTKARVINEYMRIQQNLAAVGEGGKRAIIADERLQDFLDSRGVPNTHATRRKFGEFMDNYRASVIGKIAPSEDAFDFFEEFGEDARIEDFIEKYERWNE